MTATARMILLPVIAAVLALAACGSQAAVSVPAVTASAAPYQQAASKPATAIPGPSRASPVPAPAPASGYALPDRTLTPGAASPDITQICPHVNPAIEKARPSTAEKTRVFILYRIPVAQRKLYFVDHLIALSHGGKNVVSNEWPQLIAQSYVKDREEAKLHTWICAHPQSLARAQAAEAANWTTAEQVLGIAP